jgi:hypothetical protein
MLIRAKFIRLFGAIVIMVRISVDISFMLRLMIITLLEIFLSEMRLTQILLGIQTAIVCSLMVMLTIKLAKLKFIKSLSLYDIFYKMHLPTLFQPLIGIIIETYKVIWKNL